MEVTSRNWHTDIDEETKEYATIGVQNYVIVDRDSLRGGKPSHDLMILFGTLASGTYSFQECKMEDTIILPHIGPVKGSELLFPSSPSKSIREKVKREERLLETMMETIRKELDTQTRRADTIEKVFDTQTKIADTIGKDVDKH